MTMTCAQTWAQDENVIIDEDFTEFPDKSGSGSIRQHEQWTIAGAYYLTSLTCLKIETFIDPNNSTTTYINGYALSPAFNYAGNVELSFNYIKPGDANTSITISIENGGYIDNVRNDQNQKDSTINITGEKHIKHLKPVKIIGATNDTRLRFSINDKKPAAIDDVKVIKLGEITLNESYDPAEAIAANATEEPIDIQTRRTLRAGIWNTLCLPFDVDMKTLESAIGTERNIELRTYSSYSEGTMHFTAPEGNAVSAGTPFLIRFSGEDVTNPTFSGITLSNKTAKTITHDEVSFVGTYTPIDLRTDGTQLFITTANKLARPTDTGKRMSGLRAYITVPSSFVTNNARLAISGNDATPVTAIACDSGSSLSDGSGRADIYNLQGQRLKTASKGLYIIGGRLTAKP